MPWNMRIYKTYTVRLQGSNNNIFEFWDCKKLDFSVFSPSGKKENATSKSRINTGFYNKNTIESEPGDSDFNGVFIWRRVWDSNPRAQGANAFQEHLVMTASITLRIYSLTKVR